jgi:hypothetical protein
MNADKPSPAFGRNQDHLSPSTPRAQRKDGKVPFPLAIFALFARDMNLSAIGIYGIRPELSGNVFQLLRVSSAGSSYLAKRPRTPR